MVISFLVAVYFQFAHEAMGFASVAETTQLVIGVVITTAGWLLVTFATRPTNRATLQSFYDLIHPLGSGWAKVVDTSNAPAQDGDMAAGLLGWFFGCATVYGFLFGTGFLLYGSTLYAAVCFAVGLLSAVGVMKLLSRANILR